jgi:hypothetical protein
MLLAPQRRHELEMRSWMAVGAQTMLFVRQQNTRATARPAFIAGKGKKKKKSVL